MKSILKQKYPHVYEDYMNSDMDLQSYLQHKYGVQIATYPFIGKKTLTFGVVIMRDTEVYYECKLGNEWISEKLHYSQFDLADKERSIASMQEALEYAFDVILKHTCLSKINVGMNPFKIILTNYLGNVYEINEDLLNLLGRVYGQCVPTCVLFLCEQEWVTADDAYKLSDYLECCNLDIYKNVSWTAIKKYINTIFENGEQINTSSNGARKGY